MASANLGRSNTCSQVVKPVLLGNAVLFGIALVPNGNRLRHPNDVQLFGVLNRIIAIDVSAISRPAGDGRKGPLGRGRLFSNEGMMSRSPNSFSAQADKGKTAPMERPNVFSTSRREKCLLIVYQVRFLYEFTHFLKNHHQA